MSRPLPATRRSTKSEYIETDTGNKISRRSQIEGKQNIMLGGKSVIMAGVVMRGDLCRKPEKPAVAGETDRRESAAATPTTAISVGRATVIATNAVLKPPMRQSRGRMTFYPMKIGDNVFVGPETVVSAISIGSNVHIGANCVLSPFCAIKDNCRVLPDAVVPSHMIVPPGSIVAGRPARIIGEVSDGRGQFVGDSMGEGEGWVEGGDLRPLVRSIK